MTFDEKEANDRLEVVTEMCKKAILRKDMLVSTHNLINNILSVACENVADVMLNDEPERVIISCDASIKENPGGPSALGIVIERPGESPLFMSRRSKAKTNNQAEYEAIYFGLTTLFNLANNPRQEIEVRSDSKLAIYQINGDMECKDEKLREKRNYLHELTKELPVPVRFVWRPRNSTEALQKANYLAQDELGVRNH